MSSFKIAQTFTGAVTAAGGDYSTYGANSHVLLPFGALSLVLKTMWQVFPYPTHLKLPYYLCFQAVYIQLKEAFSYGL